MHNRQYLDLQIIWKDDDMFELKVTTSNGRFSGKTEVYDTQDSLLPFAKSLKSFPGKDKILIHQAGEMGSYAYFSMKFYCIDNYGHLGVQVSLEENVPNDYRTEEKSKATFEILVEPAAIDIFQNELVHLAENQEGNARLYGAII